MSDEFSTLSWSSIAISKAPILAVVVCVLLVSCMTHHEIPPYSGPVAPPQVAYRIDDHRYFEIVPTENYACSRARLLYVDTTRGIRTRVTNWDNVIGGRLFIDAANDQYLISPILGVDPSDCQSGDRRVMDACLVSRFRYSVDAGQTWKAIRSTAIQDHEDMYLIGETLYHAGLKARVPDLVKGDSAWSAFPADRHDQLPPLSKPPIDNEPHCERAKNVKE
jgi:hypothetical protein